MSIKVKFSVLLLAAFSTIACNQGFSSSSNQPSSFSQSNLSSQSNDCSPSMAISSSENQSSIPVEKTYHPINESWVDEDVFSKSVDYTLESTLSLAEANDFVNNDFANNYNQVSRTKFTTIERTKKEPLMVPIFYLSLIVGNRMTSLI